MKREIYTIALSIKMLIALLIIPSCISEQHIDCDVLNQQLTVYLSFANTRAKNQHGTRTEDGNHDGAFNEEKIQTLDVFFYEGATLKWKVPSANLTFNDNTATIPIDSDKRELFLNNTTHTYHVYIVANNTADLSSIVEGDNNLETLKDLVFQTTDFVEKGGAEAQTSFVMDGKISQIINLNNPVLQSVYLKRAASKIRLRVVEIDVPNFTLEGVPSAQLMHFSDKSALIEGGAIPSINGTDWKSTPLRPLSQTPPSNIGGGLYTTEAPFYAYANNWQSNPEQETYIWLEVPLKDTNGVIQYFHYRVPITPKNLTGAQAQYMNRLDRNYLYDIAVKVDMPGTIDEPPVELTGNYTIIDWTTQEVLVDIQGAHYLVVSEQNLVMPNINQYTLTFNSSVPNVTIVPNSLKATYTSVNASTGVETTVNVSPAQMPTVTVQPNVASGTIAISSPIPVNYMPKDIEFKITNGQTGLIETVKIRQLPPTYFTTQLGVRALGQNGYPITTPPDNLPNKHMYMVTTLAPAGDIIWGFPPIGSDGFTMNSYEVSQMCSPRFMMASQFGAVYPMSFNSARIRCNDYWEETIINGVTVRYDDWRLPTEAEIKYIDNLQRDPNNPQGTVMAGKWYWDAYSADGAYQMIGGTGGSSTNAYIRCIRDIKD